METISAYRTGVPLRWNDAELGIYLVFIFGEINKSECTLLCASIPCETQAISISIAGGKGRAAFCHTPPVDKNAKVKPVVDYSGYPLTSHGEMLLALVQSGIASYPNKNVALQYFETVARYTDFFKVRKECILPTLEAMIDPRYVPSFIHDTTTKFALEGCIVAMHVTGHDYSTSSTNSLKKTERRSHQTSVPQLSTTCAIFCPSLLKYQS
jgi:hypothetical protein